MDGTTDTMEAAFAQLRDALNAVERAAGVKVGRWTMRVSAWDAPIELCEAFAAIGGTVEDDFPGVLHPLSQQTGAGNEIAIKAHVRWSQRADLAFLALTPTQRATLDKLAEVAP